MLALLTPTAVVLSLLVLGRLLVLGLLVLGKSGREPGPSSLEPVFTDGGEIFASFPELK